MKNLFLALCVFVSFSMLYAQETEATNYPTFGIALTFGMTPINPEQINNRIGNSNYALGSEAKSIKSLPEIAGTFVFHPMNDFKILVLRAGYSSIDRVFNLSTPQTTTSSTPVGSIKGSITETYSVIPFSFGFGATTAKSEARFQVEFIYALSSITEKASYELLSGEKFSYTRTLSSPAYGARIGGNLAIPISSNFKMLFEVTYRYLLFDEYEDDKAAQYNFVEFPVSGVNVSLGIEFGK